MANAQANMTRASDHLSFHKHLLEDKQVVTHTEIAIQNAQWYLSNVIKLRRPTAQSPLLLYSRDATKNGRNGSGVSTKGASQLNFVPAIQVNWEHTTTINNSAAFIDVTVSLVHVQSGTTSTIEQVVLTQNHYNIPYRAEYTLEDFRVIQLKESVKVINDRPNHRAAR